MTSPLAGPVEALFEAVRSGGPDDFRAALEGIMRGTREAGPADVQAALVRLEPMLARLPLGMGPDLAQIAGAMVDFGADPGVVLPTLVERAAGAMEQAARFAQLFRAVAGGLPDPGDLGQVAAARARFVATAPGRGMAEEEAEALVQAWFCGDAWVQPVLYLNQRRDVRAALPQRERLLAAAGPASELLGNAAWLEGLLLVLDDEPLVVLDRGFAGTGRGFRVTIGGIGDNFQLHTLLAAALIGDDTAAHRLPGRRPTETEIAAATDGEELMPQGGIQGNWNLVDARGEWIWNEGRPADIPHLDGVRVVVLDPEPYPRHWTSGRPYPLMAPQLRVDEVLPPAESAAWLARCETPARAE
ncbi:hypothetical protein [Dactylosporangium sp. NPDC048998]|uniref:hypothetical protein n=1 Tax=Dactylosporangium sp. NPDC048998 TaxID=3363976 RepID=UPI00371D842E